MSLLEIKNDAQVYGYFCYAQKNGKIVLHENADVQGQILQIVLDWLWARLKVKLSPGREPIPRHMPAAPRAPVRRAALRIARPPQDTLFAVLPGAACRTARFRANLEDVGKWLEKQEDEQK
jgi:hypothetical protein